MLTECPKCLSVLKVSAELIYATDPRVRCGECLRVFSARDHITQANNDLDSTRVYDATGGEALEEEQNAVAFSLRPEVAQSLQALIDKPQKSRHPNRPATPPTASNLERQRRAAIPSRRSDVKPQAKAPRPTSPNTPPPKPMAVDFDPDEEYNARRISVLGRSVGRNVPNNRKWTIATYVFLGFLTLLAINSLANLFSSPEETPEVLSTWCGQSNCAEASRDYSNLQILRRKIYAHPNIDGVLVISLAMVNRLKINMLYPTLQVRMTDRAGDVIATGQFTPEQYVNGFEQSNSIRSEEIIDVVLRVKDPGEAAQSFDLEFL